MRGMKVSTVRIEVDQAIRGHECNSFANANEPKMKFRFPSTLLTFLSTVHVRRKVAHRSSSRDIFLSLDDFDTTSFRSFVYIS